MGRARESQGWAEELRGAGAARGQPCQAPPQPPPISEMLLARDRRAAAAPRG